MVRAHRLGKAGLGKHSRYWPSSRPGSGCIPTHPPGFSAQKRKHFDFCFCSTVEPCYVIKLPPDLQSSCLCHLCAETAGVMTKPRHKNCLCRICSVTNQNRVWQGLPSPPSVPASPGYLQLAGLSVLAPDFICTLEGITTVG